MRELKRRWPGVSIFVDHNDRLTLRAVANTSEAAADLDACLRLALFFRDQPKEWVMGSWCACGACTVPEGCATRSRPEAAPPQPRNAAAPRRGR